MKQKLSRPKSSFSKGHDGFKSVDHVCSILHCKIGKPGPVTHLEIGD